MSAFLSHWNDVATGVLSLGAIVVSLMSWMTARRAQRLAERQEERRSPRLEIRLLDAFSATNGTVRTFSFHAQVVNPTDTANTISALELCIQYRRELPMTLLVAAAPARNETETLLVVPIRVDAHHTMIGWAHFDVDTAFLKDAVIDCYALVATDTHLNRTRAETNVLFRGG